VFDCDDGDVCTVDTCQRDGCSHLPIPGCCSQPADCDDANHCTDDVCAANQCSHFANVSACTDGDPCTESDKCEAGACSGLAVNCDDGNGCTQDQCIAGVCHSDFAPTPACCVEDLDCADADPCSVDACDPGGNCTHANDPQCCNSDAECQAGASSSTAWCRPGNSAALGLNGSSHMTTDPPGYWPYEHDWSASTFTVETWFRWDGGGSAVATSDPSTGGVMAYPLVARGRHDPLRRYARARVNYFLGIDATTHVLLGDLEEHTTGSNPGQNHPVHGTSTILPGAWHHAAMTYDGSCWQLFLDGHPETDGTNCPNEPANHESWCAFTVGTTQDYDSWVDGHFKGAVDEVRLWSRALSSTEILSGVEQPVDCDVDLVGRWTFDGSGSVALDSSGSGRHGLVVGEVWETSGLPDLGGDVCADLGFDPCDLDDPDEDGFDTAIDNCPFTANDQMDNDGDGSGDVCDNCPGAANPTQVDTDVDGKGDVCDLDDDGDTVLDGEDNCPIVVNSDQTDTDMDGDGDACDVDDDADGLPDGEDNCPKLANDQTDTDGDGHGDACDNCTALENGAQSDVDADGEGDACDLDDGVIHLLWVGPENVEWQEESGYDTWNSYRGDLDVLRNTTLYTQSPGSNPAAERTCALVQSSLVDPDTPGSGTVFIYLTTGSLGGAEGGLGTDGTGASRPNANPCP